jgi:hypothetical protein
MDLQHRMHWLHLEPTHLYKLPRLTMLLWSVPSTRYALRSAPASTACSISSRLPLSFSAGEDGIQRES